MKVSKQDMDYCFTVEVPYHVSSSVAINILNNAIGRRKRYVLIQMEKMHEHKYEPISLGKRVKKLGDNLKYYFLEAKMVDNKVFFMYGESLQVKPDDDKDNYVGSLSENYKYLNEG